MNIQTILTIFGITATILFGIWAIIMTFRSIKGVQITYIEDQCISLIDDITQSFSDLQISYRNESISENLVLLKGYFINTGRKDISKEMVEESISMNLPKDFEWIDCKVVDSSKSLKASVSNMENTNIKFNIGLWKVNEYFKFDALTKVPLLELKENENNLSEDKPNIRLCKSISFYHRISDLHKIITTKVPRSNKKSKSSIDSHFNIFRNMFFSTLFGLATILMGVFFYFVSNLIIEKNIGYKIIYDGKERIVQVKVDKGNIKLFDKEEFKETITLNNFNNIKDKQAIIVTKIDETFKIMGYLYILMGIFLLIGITWKRYREKKILNLITTKDKT